MIRRLIFALLPALAACAASEEEPDMLTYTPMDEPLIEQRADPWIVRTDEGKYVFIATAPEYDRIELRAADTLEGLRDAEPKVIWRKKDEGPMGHHIWAPELHYVDGAWRIYFAAGEAERIWNIRMYALTNESDDPMTGEWVENGRIMTDRDSFSLDATVFEHEGETYYVWAQKVREDHNTGLVISKMADATTLTGPEVVLTVPEYDWEVQGYRVNEGPAVIKNDGKIFITYSASATDHNYAVGLLWADEDADLLDAESWNKAEQPIFSSNAEVNRFGPGHNGFVKADDGETDLVVYHARNYKEIEGPALDNPDRHTYVRPLRWTDEGFPDFSQDENFDD